MGPLPDVDTVALVREMSGSDNIMKVMVKLMKAIYTTYERGTRGCTSHIED